MNGIKFIDDNGTFKLKNPQHTSGLYLPLAGMKGLKSAVTPDFGGDAKVDQNHFLIAPKSIMNLSSDRDTRNFFLIYPDGLWSATGTSAAQEAARFEPVVAIPKDILKARDSEENSLISVANYIKNNGLKNLHEDLRRDINEMTERLKTMKAVIVEDLSVKIDTNTIGDWYEDSGYITGTIMASAGIAKVGELLSGVEVVEADVEAENVVKSISKTDIYLDGIVDTAGDIDAEKMRTLRLAIQRGEFSKEEISELCVKVGELGITEEYESTMKSINFGKYLRNIVGEPPEGMYDPHAHHILFKTGPLCDANTAAGDTQTGTVETVESGDSDSEAQTDDSKEAEPGNSIQKELEAIEEKNSALNDTDTSDMTQFEMNTLAGERYSLWDDELNSIWSRLTEQISASEKEALVKEQQAWIKRKDGAMGETFEVSEDVQNELDNLDYTLEDTLELLEGQWIFDVG